MRGESRLEGREVMLRPDALERRQTMRRRPSGLGEGVVAGQAFEPGIERFGHGLLGGD